MSSSNQNLSSDQLNWSLGCDRFRGISALFDGMGGLVDKTEYQNCPSNFFILCVSMFKVCHQLCYEFENLMSSWRV